MSLAPSVVPSRRRRSPPSPPSSSPPQPATKTNMSAAHANSSATSLFLFTELPLLVGRPDLVIPGLIPLIPTRPPRAASWSLAPRPATASGRLYPLAGQSGQQHLGPERSAVLSGCATVVSPVNPAASTSSKPMTESSSGTGTPAAWAASMTPIAWTSEVANTAVGRLGSASTSAAAARAAARPCGRRSVNSGASGAPRRPAPPRSPHASGRWSRTRTDSPPRRPRTRSAGGRARAGARPPAGRLRRRRS